MANFLDQINNRLKEKDGHKEFVLIFAEGSETGHNISITQADIRNLTG